MKLHELKIEEDFYWAVKNGYKTFELRKNDRDYKTFDTIHFVNENGYEYLGEQKNVYLITYVLKNVEEYGLDKDYCILSIKKLEVTSND